MHKASIILLMSTILLHLFFQMPAGAKSTIPEQFLQYSQAWGLGAISQVHEQSWAPDEVTAAHLSASILETVLLRAQDDQSIKLPLIEYAWWKHLNHYYPRIADSDDLFLPDMETKTWKTELADIQNQTSLTVDIMREKPFSILFIDIFAQDDVQEKFQLEAWQFARRISKHIDGRRIHLFRHRITDDLKPHINLSAYSHPEPIPLFRSKPMMQATYLAQYEQLLKTRPFHMEPLRAERVSIDSSEIHPGDIITVTHHLIRQKPVNIRINSIEAQFQDQLGNPLTNVELVDSGPLKLTTDKTGKMQINQRYRIPSINIPGTVQVNAHISYSVSIPPSRQELILSGWNLLYEDSADLFIPIPIQDPIFTHLMRWKKEGRFTHLSLQDLAGGKILTALDILSILKEMEKESKISGALSKKDLDIFQNLKIRFSRTAKVFELWHQQTHQVSTYKKEIRHVTGAASPGQFSLSPLTPFSPTPGKICK